MVLGGLDVCVSKYLCHAQSRLRWSAAQLIATCAQNMPQVQDHLLKIKALPKLLHLTDSDPHPTVRVKALYAVSCEYGMSWWLKCAAWNISNGLLSQLQVWFESKTPDWRLFCPTMASPCWWEVCSQNTISSRPSRRSFCSICWRHILSRKVQNDDKWFVFHDLIENSRRGEYRICAWLPTACDVYQETSLCRSFFLQIPWSPWGWCSSWFLCCALRTQLFMSMSSVHFVGKAIYQSSSCSSQWSVE